MSLTERKKAICALVLCIAMLFGTMVPVWNGVSDLFALRTAAKGEDFEIPENGEALRKLTVDHVRQMSKVRWKTDTEINFSKSTDWTQNLIYKKGVQYIGVPYVSGRMDGDSDVYEFSDALNEKGYYTGPKSWQTMYGSDCGGGPRLGFAWSGALYECSPGNDFSYEPTKENFEKQGMAPVGDYAWEKFDKSRSRSTYETIMTATGEQKMFECYAKVREGDVVWSFFLTGEHIRLITADATVVRNADGTVNGEKSQLRILEQTSGIWQKSNGTASTWNAQMMSFKELYDTGYIPLTMTAYDKTSVEKPVFSTDNLNLSGNVNAYDLLSGRVNCNYNIFKLEATITDSKGKVVTVGTSYPYMITADLSRMSFSTKLTELKSGKYHYKLVATIGYGTKVLVDSDIDYENVGELVVFISDKGTGNGFSPDAPLGNAEGFEPITTTSFKNSALYRAVQFLSQTGGTVVVCGKVSIISGHYYGTANMSDFVLPGVPVDGSTVKITSVYNGVDYRKQGACITVKKTNKMNTNIELKIDTVWDDVDMVFNYTTGAARYNVIACCNRKTVFGPGFNVRCIYDGEELPQTAASSAVYPVLVGGYRYAVDPGSTDLTVYGGYFKDVAAGPLGVDGAAYGILEGSTKLTIGKKATVFGSVYGASYDTVGYVTGDIDISVTGGLIRGDIVLGGNGGVEGENNKATLTVSGKPEIKGNVRVIGDKATHSAPAVKILDFTNARSDSKLPGYTPGLFTEIREQVIDLEREAEEDRLTETTEAVTSPEDTAADTAEESTGGAVSESGRTASAKPGFPWWILIIAGIVAVTAAALVFINKSDKKA